jgi:hypothetical protein
MSSPHTIVTEGQRATLVSLLRTAFPHPRFPDGPYERTADAVLTAADGALWSRLSLLQGLASLDSLAGGRFVDLDEADATRTLLHVADTEFFHLVRRTAVVVLYDDPQVWELLGYEGPSFDKGGYLDRGFDDLDWLPDPRVEEYDGPEQLVEVALPGHRAGTTTAPTASHPGMVTKQADRIAPTAGAGTEPEAGRA